MFETFLSLLSNFFIVIRVILFKVNLEPLDIANKISHVKQDLII